MAIALTLIVGLAITFIIIITAFVAGHRAWASGRYIWAFVVAWLWMLLGLVVLLTTIGVEYGFRHSEQPTVSASTPAPTPRATQIAGGSPSAQPASSGDNSILWWSAIGAGGSLLGGVAACVTLFRKT
jgi:hypothetical protein